MATFTGQLISATYDAIIKTIDNDAIGGTAKQLTDGLGNVTPLYVSTTQIGIGITPTEALHVSGNIKASSSVIATTFSGDLNGTINTATTGVTQTAGDNTTKIATTAFVQESHTGKPTGSGTGGKIALWSGSGTSTVLTDSSITEESTQYLLTKDIRIFDTIPGITLQDSDSSGSASSGSITWLDNAASQRAIISLTNSILGITSKHGGINFGTNSTPAVSIDSSQNTEFFGSISSTSTITATSYIQSDSNLLVKGDVKFRNNADSSWNGGQIGSDANDSLRFAVKTAASSNVEALTLDANLKANFTGSIAIGGNATTIASFVTESDTIASNDNDTTLPTSAAVKDYVDTQVGANNELSEILANGNTTGGTKIEVNNTSSGIDLIDDAKIRLGTGNDLQIYHNGSQDRIESSSAFLVLEASNVILRNNGGSEDYAKFLGNAAVELYYNNSKKFETTSTGVSVTGALTGTSATFSTSGTPLSLNRTGGATALVELKIGGTVEGYLGADSTKSLIVFNESAAEKFSISNGGDGTFAGNVTLSQPTNGAEAKLILTSKSAAGNSRTGIVEYDADTEKIFFINESTTVAAMTSGGNVGIGTDSPDYKLEIESTSDADLVSIKSTAIANNTQMRLGISGNDSVISGTGGSTGSLVFKTYGSERARIDSDGSLIVGTATVAAANAAADNIVIKGTGAAVGLTISQDTNSGTGTIFFGDAASSAAAGFRYNHNTGDMAISAEDDINFTCDNATFSGNVGIGTDSPDFALDIEGLDSGVQLQIGRTNSSAGSTWMGSDSNGFHLGVGAYGAGNSVSDPNGFTVDTSGNTTLKGNLIINKFSVGAPYGNGEIRFTGQYDRYLGGIKTYSDNPSYPDYANGLEFFVQRHVYALPNGHLAMRITSEGKTEFKSNVDILTPATLNSNILKVRSQNSSGFTSSVLLVDCDRTTTNNTYNLAAFTNAGTAKCVITDGGDLKNTNNSYGAISDERLKENITDATPKLDDLMKVKIRNYNLIGDDKKQIGVVAQELEEVFPNMIDESIDYEYKNIEDEDGNTTEQNIDLGTTTKSVKYSVFVPMLIKAIQELKAEIDDLKNKCNCK